MKRDDELMFYTECWRELRSFLSEVVRDNTGEYESCPELGDMSVADMRKAGHYLHKMLTKKAPSQGAAPVRNGAPVASDSGSTSAPDGREPMPVAGYGEGM